MPTLRLIEIAVVAAIGSILLALIPDRYDTTWVDPVTGSVKKQTSWQIYTQAPTIEMSSLERRIIAREGSHIHAWKRVGQTRRSFFGLPLSVSCSEPPMFLLRAGEPNDRFVRNSNDGQIAEFVRVMRTGPEDARREAILAASASGSPNH